MEETLTRIIKRSQSEKPAYFMIPTVHHSGRCKTKQPMEKEMATHSRILAWRIPWTEEPGGLQSMGLQRVGHDWATNTQPVNMMRKPQIPRVRRGPEARVVIGSWHTARTHWNGHIVYDHHPDTLAAACSCGVSPLLMATWFSPAGLECALCILKMRLSKKMASSNPVPLLEKQSGYGSYEILWSF